MINDIKEFMTITSFAYRNRESKLCLSKCQEDIYRFDRPLITIARRFIFPSQFNEYDLLSAINISEKKEITKNREEMLNKRKENIRNARLAVHLYRCGNEHDFLSLPANDPKRSLFVPFGEQRIGILTDIVSSINEKAKTEKAKTEKAHKEKAEMPLPVPWPLFGEKMDDIICKAIELGPLSLGKEVQFPPNDIRAIVKRCKEVSGKNTMVRPSFAIMMVSYYVYQKEATKSDQVLFSMEMVQCWTNAYKSYWKEFVDSGILSFEKKDDRYYATGIKLERKENEPINPSTRALQPKNGLESSIAENGFLFFRDEGALTMDHLKTILMDNKKRYN